MREPIIDLHVEVKNRDVSMTRIREETEIQINWDKI